MQEREAKKRRTLEKTRKVVIMSLSSAHRREGVKQMLFQRRHGEALAEQHPEYRWCSLRELFRAEVSGAHALI